MNCGPNPCHSEYMAHETSPGNIDLSDACSHKDLAAMKHSLKGKGFIYLCLDGSVEPVHRYRDIMELMTPDVIVVPILSFQSDGEASSVFQELMPISQEYAARMQWGWV